MITITPIQLLRISRSNQKYEKIFEIGIRKTYILVLRSITQVTFTNFNSEIWILWRMRGKMKNGQDIPNTRLNNAISIHYRSTFESWCSVVFFEVGEQFIV